MSSPNLDGYWNRRTETMPRPELAEWQWTKLQRAVAHARRRSPFWAERLPGNLHSLQDFRDRVPLITKSELVSAQRGTSSPYGTLAAVDPVLGVRYHQSSGTSGNPPFRTFDTTRDWTWAVDGWCIGLHAAGVRENQVGMTAFGYGLFQGFWGMHQALERMGCLVVSSGGTDTRGRLKLLLDHRVEILGATPTYALRLLECAREMGVDLASESAVQLVVTAAEPRPAATARILSEGFGARLSDAAGMTELGTICTFECPTSSGAAHIIETAVLEEVLHPTSLGPVGYGEQGVRVMTALGREGLPVFRYWTDDLVTRRPADGCGCGRTWDYYEGGIVGRNDDMRKIGGIAVTPAMIEDIVRGVPTVAEFEARLRNTRGVDELVLTLEPFQGASMTGVPEAIADAMKRQIGIRPIARTVAAGTLPRYEAKAVRMHDDRTW